MPDSSDDAGRAALLSALTTEHFVLQTANGGTIAEAGARATLYVMALSSALVAMGFASRSRDVLVPFVATVLPALFVLGVLTVIRLIDTALESQQYLVGIARIRAHYRTLAPEAGRLFAPERGRWPEAGGSPALGLGTMIAFLGTSAATVAVINAIVAGAGVTLLVRDRLGTERTTLALSLGALAALLLTLAFYRFQRWRFATFEPVLAWERERATSAGASQRVVAGLLLLAAAALRAGAQPPRADLVLVNGRVLTVDANDRVAQAVGVAGNRIVAVGTTAEVLRAAAPNARRIDLRGRTVTPGLLDAHAHFSGGGGDRLFVVDLSYPNVKSIADVAAAVRAKAAAIPHGAWIVGRGWDEGKLAERRVLTAADLDAASPENPVVLTQTTGHYAVANSAALRLAGVTKETRDPPNGTIDRAADGAPTGLLRESAAGLVRRLVPPRTAAETEAGIRDFARAFNAECMTGAKDPGISAETWDIYRKVLRDSALTVRVFALWSGGRSVAGAERLIAERAATTRPYESTGDDRLIAGGVKLYADGSGGARTAWLYDDWSRDYRGTDAGNRGYPASNADTIRLLIRKYHDAGMHVSVHSIGDRAIDWVVDTYDQAMRENPKKGLRHGIIHANIPTDHAIDVMARLQREFDAGYPEPSATFAWWLGDTYAGNFGVARSLRLNPFATFRAKGMTWANGSDYGVTPFAARYGVWSAVARRPLLGVYGGDPFGRKESVDVRTALRAVTIWAARQMFLERKTGSIEVGKYADLAVWDRDFYRVPTDSIKDAKCEMTIFDGKVVHDASARR